MPAQTGHKRQAKQRQRVVRVEYEPAAHFALPAVHGWLTSAACWFALLASLAAFIWAMGMLPDLTWVTGKLSSGAAAVCYTTRWLYEA